MVVAFDEGSGEPRVFVHTEDREHTQALLRLVDQACGGNRDAIEAIVVVRGPGAYAGLRVGVATAQSLGLALGVPVTGVTTFEAAHEAMLASTGGQVPPQSLGIHPAGRGEFAVQPFASGVPTGESSVAAPGALPALPLFGEGAGVLGGIEVPSLDRCLGALRLQRRGETSEAAALYVREPHITLPKATTALGRPPG
jgi:tRNA threonylcarbamoyl adenosine modification protein YeaZ